jgi:hypothetical protein
VRERGWTRQPSGRLGGLLLCLPRLPPPWPSALPAQQRWTLILTALGLYSAFVTPFRLAFVGAHLNGGTHRSSDDFNTFGLFIDMVFVFDTRAPPAARAPLLPRTAAPALRALPPHAASRAS